MKTMITLLFSALCVATVSAQTDEKDNAMLNNGINFLDIPYVAHTLDVTDGEEELIINCDEVDCTTFVEYTLPICKRSVTVMEKSTVILHACTTLQTG